MTKKSVSTFGMHLMLDAYGVPFEKLDDMKLVYKFLYELPEKIGMSKLTSPIVVNADQSASGYDPGGISGMVLINESHITIHTFSKRGFFTMDVYSCRNFQKQVKKLLKHIMTIFPYTESELQIVERGTKYSLNNISSPKGLHGKNK